MLHDMYYICNLMINWRKNADFWRPNLTNPWQIIIDAKERSRNSHVGNLNNTEISQPKLFECFDVTIEISWYWEASNWWYKDFFHNIRVLSYCVSDVRYDAMIYFSGWHVMLWYISLTCDVSHDLSIIQVLIVIQDLNKNALITMTS